MGCVLQDFQVRLRAGPFVVFLAETIVSQAEPGRGKQVFAIGIVRECARLADERVDDVPVVDRMAVPAHQSRQRIHLPIRKPNLDPVGEEPGFDLLANQPTVDRVGIAVNVNQTAGVHATGDFQTRRQPLIRQVPQRPNLLGEAVDSAGVANVHEVMQEIRILLAAGEIPTAPQQERLVNGGLEVTVRRFGVAILLGLAHVDPLAR